MEIPHPIHIHSQKIDWLDHFSQQELLYQSIAIKSKYS